MCMFVCVCVWLEKGLGKEPPRLNFSSVSNARCCPDWLFLLVSICLFVKSSLRMASGILPNSKRSFSGDIRNSFAP